MLSNTGDKWRLIHDLDKGKYCFLIGVDKWAIELEENEFNSLAEVLNKLNLELSLLKEQIMEEELVNLEIESLPWYAELEGSKNEWSLRLVFESIEETRSFEMYWPILIAETLLFEIIKMWESIH